MVELAAALLFDGAVCFGGVFDGVKSSFGASGCLGDRLVTGGFGGGDERSGAIERVGFDESVQPLDEGEAATTVARRQGEAAVDAAFDVEGEPAPGVAGEAVIGDRAEALGEVRRGASSVIQGADAGDSCVSEGVVDGREVVFDLASFSGGEDISGLAESVEAEGEGIVLMDGSEDDVGPVAGESPVDAVEFGVAPLVGSRPAGVFVDG